MGRDEQLADLVPMLRGPLGVRMQPASPSESGLDTTFARLDANGDGKLDSGEREQAVKSLRKFDQNDDEALSSAELSAFRDPNADASVQESAAIPRSLPLYCSSIEAALESGRSSRS